MRLTIEKGYAEEVPEDEIDTDRRKWYIPHHGVYSERKPDKLRIVFDCAAQHRGVSLNQVLMQGPDLNNRLDAVLLRFRKESIPLVADVEAMFHQVLVSPRDRDSLRFLWWRDRDFTKEAIPHRMKVHLFGATSFPSCAAFSLRQAALDFGHGYEPLVAPTVEGAAYVDNVLVSVSDVEAELPKSVQAHWIDSNLHKRTLRVTLNRCKWRQRTRVLHRWRSRVQLRARNRVRMCARNHVRMRAVSHGRMRARNRVRMRARNRVRLRARNRVRMNEGSRVRVSARKM